MAKNTTRGTYLYGYTKQQSVIISNTGVTKIVPQINTIIEIEFLDPFLAFRNNPTETGNKNNINNTSNRRLDANVVNPIQNSDVSMSTTLL